jgi:hypothetical protein
MPLPAIFALATTVASPPTIIDAPVHAVTVYSDRARVTRTGSIDVSGARDVELPLSARGVDPRSIMVSSSGAELARVDVVWKPADALPRAHVEEVLDAIAKLDDQIALLTAERNAWQWQLDTVNGLHPQLPPVELGRPQPKLAAGGWGVALQFARDRAATAQAHVRAAIQKARPLERERQRLLIEAQKIDASVLEAGYRVVAHLSGHGTAKLTMTYMVGRARWRPTYELQLDPATSKLDLQFSGEVSQESGEDWSDAQLALSTAEPATATRYPKVNSWRVGERERFIPTPIAASNAPSPPPDAPPLPRVVSDDEPLRQRLAALLGPRGGAWGRQEAQGAATTDSPDREYRLDEDGLGDVDKDRAVYKTPAPVASAPPPPPSPKPEPEVTVQATVVRPTRTFHARPIAIASSPASSAPTESVGLVAPAGWSRPSYASDLPASLAGGYDLVYSALQPETVLSGKGTRRVALLSRRWPVNIERKIYPALGPDTFLVAELKSQDKKPLPGGTGHLFVGADPAGVAQLPLILPSETVTLPLGLDRAIRPVRNVKVVTAQRGVINKEEISEYTVTIELANPYSNATPVRVIDQIPIAGDTGAKNVEVKLARAEPTIATRDDARGTLEWKLVLPPSGKSTVTFVYTIKRPKGFQLRQ